MYYVDYSNPFNPAVRESEDGMLTFNQARDLALASLQAQSDTIQHSIQRLLEMETAS